MKSFVVKYGWSVVKLLIRALIKYETTNEPRFVIDYPEGFTNNGTIVVKYNEKSVSYKWENGKFVSVSYGEVE